MHVTTSSAPLPRVDAPGARFLDDVPMASIRPPIHVLGDTPTGGVAIERRAVRGVVTDAAGHLLLLRSRDGDLKFPGGGVELGERDREALARELDEECGCDLLGLDELLVTVIERRNAAERPDWVFEMTSRYYACRTSEAVRATRPEPYEREAGLTPVWIGGRDALAANQEALQRGASGAWIPRELLVLEHLANAGLLR